MSEETFTKNKIEAAIRSFLEYGEQEYLKSQQGYFSGPGWAARCLRYHHEQLKVQKDDEDTVVSLCEEVNRLNSKISVLEFQSNQWKELYERELVTQGKIIK